MTDVLIWGTEALVIAVVIYAFIRFLQETRGSAVMKGFIFMTLLVTVGFVTLVKNLGLLHLHYIAQHSLTILLTGIVIIFQPELRQALVRLGESKLLQRLSPSTGPRRTLSDEVVQAAERLSRRGLGAIVIIERNVGIAGFTEGGVLLDAEVSAPLLVTIFFKDTPLHDGAVVIRGRRIVAAGCLLPLSENPTISKSHGTRHRAAIGATEENDAIAVVVSEETQKISVAHRGSLHTDLSEKDLKEFLAAPFEKKPKASAEVAVP